MISRRRSTLAAVLALSTALLAPAVNATGASYPSKPITIVYPYASGGASDALARQIGEIITKALGQPVIVDAKPGAGGQPHSNWPHARLPTDIRSF